MRIRWMIAALVCLQLLLIGCAANVESVASVQGDMAESAGDVLEIPSATASFVPKQLAAHPTPAGTAVAAPTISTEPSPTNTPTPTPKPTPEPTPEYELKNIVDTEGYIKGHDVNIRKGPGTDYDKVGEIDYHTVVTITAKTDEWYQIETDEIEGFILKEFVGVGAVPTPTPTPKPKAKSTPKPTATPEEETPKATPEPEIEQGGEGDYTEEEIYLVAKLIYAEGKNQSEESFLAMASVLYNRCNSKRFGGSVEREVYRSGQFSVVNNSDFEDLKPSSAALAAAKKVFLGGKRTIPAGVMYFRSASKGKYWSSREFYKTIGGNNYYY